MSKLFASLANVVTRRPGAALGLLAVVTAVLFAGIGMRVDQAGNDVFLPGDSDVAEASDTLLESFLLCGM